MTKREKIEYVQRERPHKTLQELSDELGISREMVRRYCEASNAPSPFKTLRAALKEIKRLTALVDSCQPKVIATTELSR